MSPRVECLPRKHEALSLIPPALPDSEHDGACLNYSEFEGGLSEIPISKKKLESDVRLEPPSAEYLTEHLPSRGERVRNPASSEETTCKVNIPMFVSEAPCSWWHWYLSKAEGERYSVSCLTESASSPEDAGVWRETARVSLAN